MSPGFIYAIRKHLFKMSADFAYKLEIYLFCKLCYLF
jgi:hypothetical protein